MIRSLLDVVRFLERLGIAHEVPGKRPEVHFTFNDVQMVIRWDIARRRVQALRTDEDHEAVLDRMALLFDPAGQVTEPALLHLMTAAAQGSAAAATLPQGA
jgi:hypothetical protein